MHCFRSASLYCFNPLNGVWQMCLLGAANSFVVPQLGLSPVADPAFPGLSQGNEEDWEAFLAEADPVLFQEYVVSWLVIPDSDLAVAYDRFY